MAKKKEFTPVKRSLGDLLGEGYVQSMCRARSFLTGETYGDLKRMAARKVDLFPESFQRRLKRLVPRTGDQVCPALPRSARGSSTDAFNAATKTGRAPLTGMGYFRIGENGKLCMSTKSAHYHAPLGHNFPGYALLETARRLGIPNATHNNTRGHIARTLEQQLVREAGCTKGPGPILDSVINLETGSLAVEAALKMVLGRFYKAQEDSPRPQYADRIPVIIVVGNDGGGLQANYHGTTMLTQTLRGMWPGFAERLEKGKLFTVRAVRPNNKADLREVFGKYDKGKYKIAAFFHEIVMMNYAGTVLEPSFLKLAYRLCKKADAPTVDDEIQSCIWHHDMFMFKEWGLRPDFVALGKGFPGGEYAASRILFNSAFDVLPQFGALVTNGQEEIASLAYLVTMAWARANSKATRRLGEYFEERIRTIGNENEHFIAGINGKRHMLAITFQEVDPAKAFAAELNDQGIDISVQTYKTEVPPAAMLKLPLIMDRKAIDSLCFHIENALGNSGE
ncbi:aminotransferase class III-fold pyridoxal phosphate-dependent enzyme [Planctomycetota bacterium]